MVQSRKRPKHLMVIEKGQMTHQKSLQGLLPEVSVKSTTFAGYIL